MNLGDKRPQVFTPRERAEFNELGLAALKFAQPLVWRARDGARESIWRGATCFVLRFRAGLVGVTAGHVVEMVQEESTKTDSLSCYLRTTKLDLRGTLIAHDRVQDLATFRVTEQQLVDSQTTALDCRDDWPPPELVKDSRIICVGFPEDLRHASPNGIDRFEALAYFSVAQRATSRLIIATYDADRDYRLITHPHMPQLQSNWSGCSGGPVLMLIEQDGRQRFVPVGVIIDGPREGDRSSLQPDMYQFHRICSINPDGAIS